ncbi:MAG: Mur ligase family protein, partial [bacterium]|nr:Mur ligase family protein [bacterium]
MSTIPTNKPNSFFQWWQSPKLPPVHIWVNQETRPSNPIKFLRLYFRKWLVHPVKRRLVKYYLLYLQTFKETKVIAITGSAGKTTTKEMLASILSQKGKTVYSFENIDPVYNIPTTILKCTPNTKYVILEMGVEYPGEMEFYLWLAKPDVAVITNVYQTHTVFFGDIEGVAREKGTLVKKLDKKATAILNYDNIHTLKIGGNLNCKVVWFGKNSHASSSDSKITPNLTNKFTLHLGKDKINVQLPIVGSQFEANALAAAATAEACGATLREIKSGLEAFKSADHRMKPIKHKSGALILDDSYN